MQKITIPLISIALCASSTTFGGVAFAADSIDKAAAQIFLLPPDREQTQENVSLVMKYLEQGRAAMEKADSEKAISKFQEAYGLAREIKFTEGEGMALTEMCLYYQTKAQLPRAKQLGENALELLGESTNKKAEGQARAALARVYLLQDNTYMAMQQLNEAMKAFTDLGASDAEEASKVLLLAGDVGMKTGKIKEALQFYEGAASYSGQAGKTMTQVALQVKVTNMLIALGYCSAALEEANRAVTGARSSKKQSELAGALNALGNAQYSLCEYAAARKTYEELLSLHVPNQTPMDRAVQLEGLGFTLAATGETDLAKAALDKALPVIKKDGNASQRAEIFNGLGVLTTAQGQIPVALEHFKSALESASMANPKNEKLTALVLLNLAAAQARTGQHRDAKTHYQNAIQGANHKGFHDLQLLCRAYAGFAEVAITLKEYADAEQATRSGIQVAEKINDDAALWRLYTNLAQIQMANGTVATEALNSAVSFFRSPQAGYFPTPTELTYPTRREEKGQELVSLLVTAGMIEQALLAAEQLKEESFINEWHRKGGEVRSADRDIYNDMVSRRAHLHASEGASAPSQLIKEWRDWVIRFQHVAAENPSLARLISPVPINLPEVMKTLQTNKACIIDYLVAPQWTIAFTIDNNRRLTALRLPVGKEDLQTQVASLLTASTKTDEAARNTEHRILQLLYNELIPEEARAVFPTNPEQMVMIIPDSVLFNLPFAALLNTQGKYLVESHTLTMAPSMGILMDVPKSTKDVSVLVAGDNNSGENSEGGQISTVFDANQITTLAAKDSQIGALQEQAKTNSILHLASAVTIQQNNPLNSIMALTPLDKSNNFTASNLFGMTLPAELAVLSNTTVNAKDFRGNGVQVFSRGLNYAGVRNVLMSLWVAPDTGRTSELVEFYRSRNKGFSQAQSLRKAQLLALSKDPSPRAWAAFQLLGPGF